MRFHHALGGRAFQMVPFALAWDSITCWAHTRCICKPFKYRR